MELKQGRPQEKRIAKEERVYDLLEKLHIDYQRIDHEKASEHSSNRSFRSAKPHINLSPFVLCSLEAKITSFSPTLTEQRTVYSPIFLFPSFISTPQLTSITILMFPQSQPLHSSGNRDCTLCLALRIVSKHGKP